MEQPNVKFLTPCYGGQITAQCFHSYINFVPYALQNGIKFSIETLPNCSLICLGRDIMLWRALRDPAWTHILWVDSDLRWQPEMVHSMILDDKDIVGGFYPKKGLPIDFASSPAPGGEDTDDLFETIYVATGFMLVKRKVIEHMMEHYKEELQFKYQGSDGYVDLFAPIIDNNRLYLTEDYAFCHRARSLGYKTFMSKRFEIPHIGPYEFSAEHEKHTLDEYQSQGRITIHKDVPVNYFSALSPKTEDLPELPDNK